MTQHQPESGWPAVTPEAVAEVVAALSPRLRKRLDAAAAKLADRPVTTTGDEWRIELDEDVRLVLRAPGGVVRTAADVYCGCLLAPACLHRAAAVTVCPLAEAGAVPDSGPGDATAQGTTGPADTAPEHAALDDAAPDGPTDATTPGAVASGEDAGHLSAVEAAAVERLHRSTAGILAAGVSGAGGVPQAELLQAAHQARLAGLHRPAAAAVAVVTRVRAARSGEPDHRLAELAAGLRDLLTLTSTLRTYALPTHPTPASSDQPAPAELPAPADRLVPADRPAPAELPVPAELPALRGTARQAYTDAGGLRLHGLFAEPVLTATHAGAVTWAVDAGGRLSSVAEIMPHADPTAAAPQALAAGNRALRLGDASLSHREFSRAGLAVQGATRSAAGRLGAGAKVRAVRAAGTAWTQDPVAALWAEPIAAQVARALAYTALPYDNRPAGGDLLFLDVTLLGARSSGDGYGGSGAGSAARPWLAAECDGLPIALVPAHDHPGLAYRANLALLAEAPGLRLRVIGRLARSARPQLHLLAVGPSPLTPDGAPAAQGRDGDQEVPALRLPADRAGRVNLGLERLQRADLAAAAPSGPELPATSARSLPLPSDGCTAEAPVHLLTRRVEQAVTSGRRALVLAAGADTVDTDRLRAAGLSTAATLLDDLRAAATDQRRDVFGRLRTEDHEAFTRAWLAASCYGEELAGALCEGAWAARP
ncbi:hypothetical protein [Kitasatospora sp. NPDC050543]|uniref:hypothetical protein n=1 Tax=Kitasatospora sp. NPDC050543 TaxID=3364054 RepID=UPI0037B92763